MAKRITQQKTPDKPQRVCGDCGLGKWVEGKQNQDPDGKPICLTCPESNYHILRSQKACDKWIDKPINEKED